AQIHHPRSSRTRTARQPAEIASTTTTRLTHASAVPREAGTVSAFQIPPRVSVARGAGRDPSPAGANTPADASLPPSAPALTRPATSQGRLAASTAPPRRRNNGQ